MGENRTSRTVFLNLSSPYSRSAPTLSHVARFFFRHLQVFTFSL
jgi:hypothetical protein